jgi:putative heme-binding domain-containing protein
MNRYLGLMVMFSLAILVVSEVGSQEGKKGGAGKKKAQEPPMKRNATAPEALQTVPGFQVELLYTADPAIEGSWINLCKDHRGRLIVGGQRSQPVLRMTLKDGKVEKVETLSLPISETMGLLYAFDSLYVNGHGPKGFGLYRCRDTRNSDQYDDVQLLKEFRGAGEHGPHGVALGPDQRLYIMNGNHTDLPEGLAKDSPHRHWADDLFLPRQWDGNGHAVGRLAPGGYVLRTDAEGKKWELMLGGFRNAYDLAFNGDGELFTYDSDMEWDWGLPWYRPIRVNHCISGAEFGWRSGTGKWPDYYPDSLGAVVNIGVGSPTGVTSGLGAKFPAKYQKAIYVLDWTYGRLSAVHLKPQGAGYTAEWENFVAPKSLTSNAPKAPLNLTDAIIGDDGAMYFTVGGRNTQAALYRVSYVGPESTAPAPRENVEGAKERQVRRRLEACHGKEDAGAVAAAWPYLGSDDRALRYAARIALESQPVAAWQSLIAKEKNPRAALTALLALARVGPRESQAELLQVLDGIPLAKLAEEDRLLKLRVLQLSFVRQGSPSGTLVRKLVADLDAAYPLGSELVNRELLQLLVYLQAPRVVEKTLARMNHAHTQEDLLHSLFYLRSVPIGFWTLEQRREYLRYFKDRPNLPRNPDLVAWFAAANRPASDGASFNNYLKNIFKEAVLNMSDAERKELADVLKAIDESGTPSYDIPPRSFVKSWKMDEVQPLLAKLDKGGRSFDKGRQAYLAAQCIKCHRLGTEGGSVGPDLTAISNRFSRRDILESILDPSKVLSEQYQNVTVTTAEGKLVTGRLMDESKDRLVLQPDPLSPERVEIARTRIEAVAPSKVSPMPNNLVDVLSAEEILDLLAYLEAAGQKNYRVFQK